MSSSTQAWFKREGLALLTDYYELTMMAGYLKEGRSEQQASFDYFFRSLPPHTGFAIAAGLESFLDYVENLRFGEDDIEYLDSLGSFDDDFLSCLRQFPDDLLVHPVPREENRRGNQSLERLDKGGHG